MIKRLLTTALIAVFAAVTLTGCFSVNINTDGQSTEAPTVGNIESSAETIAATAAPAATTAPVKEVNVRPAEWESVQWQPYSNAYFTLQVPYGWQVDWNGNAQKLSWKATSPDGKIGVYNLDHDYAAKDPGMTQTLGFTYALSDASVQGYFEMIYQDAAEYFSPQNSCVPSNYDALQASAPNKQIRDYKSIYATFKDSTVGEGEGIYSAVMVDSKDIYVGNVNYGVWEFDCIVTEWAPLGQLVNWYPVLNQIAQSFSYTDYYIQEWQGWLNTGTNPSSSVNESDPVMEAFEERSKSDTIIQEKRSDMIGEYERVYDNESGNIYRAYNGFLDDMGDQSRYKAISDSQYADGYVGWIDKD